MIYMSTSHGIRVQRLLLAFCLQGTVLTCNPEFFETYLLPRMISNSLPDKRIG